MGDSLTFNNIKMTDSNIGLLNTGTIEKIRSLDISVSILGDKGNEELAEAIKRFSQILVDCEIDPSIGNSTAGRILSRTSSSQPRSTV